MKGIKEWINEMENNKEFAKKFESKNNIKEVIDLAKKEGYEFTEDDYMDLKMESVSGGGIFSKVIFKLEQGWGKLNTKIGNWISGD